MKKQDQTTSNKADWLHKTHIASFVTSAVQH